MTLVFVHGYSVTNLDTYGELPLRLRNEAILRGMDLKIEDIFLGRYISFNDEVRLDDVSRALDLAITQQIPGVTGFICITHSTGAPVVRNWWHRFYQDKATPCPMSHLIMLAPANHGSALAQLGKTKISRVKSWFDGVEPGQKILDWLELGSNEAWDLNKNWIQNGKKHISQNGIFPFVIIGQDIDRKLYDHLNSYTGELGSDGVVRAASANLNSRYIKLQQPVPQPFNGSLTSFDLEVVEFNEAPQTPFRIVTHKSHSGEEMGIMKSVNRNPTDEKSKETITAIFDCISVRTLDDYERLNERFVQETNQVQKDSLVEIENKLFKNTEYIHDRYCMVMFRLNDTEGYPITNFDLILTAGETNDPDLLPTGFFADRQCNRSNLSTITYFFNYDIMNGSAEVVAPNGEIIRKATPGIEKLGLIIKPRPDQGFIRYLACKINASRELFEQALKPNSSTLIDIYLRRIVSDEIFRFEKLKENVAPSMSFKDIKPGEDFLA